MITTNPYKEILEQYHLQRDHNIHDRKMRKMALYEQYPEFQSIDHQMSQISSEIAKAILKSPQQAEVMLIELKQTLEALKAKKRALFKTYDIPKDYLDVHYNCNVCKDTGFLEDNTRCHCFNQKLINMAYKMSNVENMLSKQNFENFDLNVFSTEIRPKEPLTQRENMKRILLDAEKFVMDFPQSHHQFYYGTSGLGKTYLCNCIAKALLDKGHSVIYQTPSGIIDIIQKKHFTDKGNAFIQLAYEQLFDVDLLIIDDLGTETANTFTISEFYSIINTRILNDRPMIISTNIKLSELSSFYNDRIDSRIKGHFDLHKFYGPDIRWEV